MGQLAVAVVGGVIGSFFGMPQLGFLLGSLIGGILFAPDAPKGVGKLNDLRVTASTYGVPITQGYGTARINGNIIWARPLAPHEHSSGKGMGGTPPSFTYTWTGGVGICQGPITDVTRIWADSKLVYDKTGQTNQNTLNKYKLNFRLYKGTEEQMPDPALEAFVGVDNATAHRGLAMIVFDNIPVADYGNHVPSWTFEVVFTGATTAATLAVEMQPDDAPTVNVEDNEAVVDWDRNRVYLFKDGASPDSGIVCCDLITGAFIREIAVADAGVGGNTQPGSAVMGKDGYLYVVGGGGAPNHAPICKIDPDTLQCVQSFGPHVPPGFAFPGFFVDGFTPPYEMLPFQIGTSNFMFCNEWNNLISGAGVFCTDTMDIRAGAVSSERYFNADDSIVVEPWVGCAVGPTDLSHATIYGVGFPNFGGDPTDPLTLYRWTINQQGEITDVRALGQISPADVNVNWTNWNFAGGVLFDQSDGNIILHVGSSDSVPTGESQHYIIKIDSDDATVVWKSPNNAQSFQDRHGNFRSTLTNGQFVFIGGSAETYNGSGDASAGGHKGIFTVTTYGGSYAREEWAIPTTSSKQVFGGDSGAIFFFGSVTGSISNQWGVIYPNRAYGGGADVADIITDQCSKVDVSAADIDVSDVTGLIVDGYVINQQQSSADSIKPLAFIFFFDGVESDYKFKFVQRGGSSIATIPKEDLGLVDAATGSSSQEVRTQDVDLPSRLSITFLDPTHDYQQATQYMSRNVHPQPTMYSSNVSSASVPIVMQPLFAKQVAEKALFTAWVNRIGYKTKLPWHYLKYDPSDVVTLEFQDGATVLTRIGETNMGADLSLEVQSMAESTATFVAGVDSASGGSGFVPQAIPGSGLTRMFLLDMPLPRDTDDVGQTFTRLYFAAGGYNEDWSGEVTYRSSDGSAYSDVGGVDTAMIWGTCTTALGDTDTPFGLDTANTINVLMQNGEDFLASVTLEQACNGANACVVYNRITGILEIVQFCTVTAETDGSFTLSDLIRGRRGTEVYCDQHSLGENLVLLTDDTGAVMNGVASMNMALVDLNVVRFFKAVGNGVPLANTTPVQFTDTGRALKPYAPVSQTAATAGSDIEIEWLRRTRLGGAWRDGTGDVPLSEDTESYEVDIYDGMGTTVLRTLTSTTSSVTYLSADITTDFGSPPATLNVVVYQMSVQIGRGFGKLVELEVTP